MHVSGEQPLHLGAQVVIAGRPEDEVEMVGHQTKADQTHGHAGASLTQEPDEVVIVVGVVKDLGAAVAAVESMVAQATDRSSRSSRHEEIVANHRLDGKGILAGDGRAGHRRAGQGTLNVPEFRVLPVSADWQRQRMAALKAFARYLDERAEAYLRAYAFYLAEKRSPERGNVLPQVR
jgi:hypothetical protein